MEYKYQLLKYIYHIDYKARINPVYSNEQYLFETFTPYINKEGLALPPSWNQMTGIKQCQKTLAKNIRQNRRRVIKARTKIDSL